MDQAAAWRMTGGPLHCQTLRVICPKQPAKGAWGPDFLAYAITTAVPPAPFAGGRQEMGASILFETPAGDAPPAWQRQPSFPGDFFHGENAAYAFRSDSGAPFAGLKLIHDPTTTSFVERPTDAVAVVRGRTTIGIIPESDAGIVANGRLFTFNGSAQGIASDTYPDIDQPPMSYLDIPEIELGLAVAVPSVSAVPSTSAAPSIAAQPSQAAAASAAPGASATPAGALPGAAASTTSGIPWLLVVLAGVLIAALGGVLFLRGSRAGTTVAAGSTSDHGATSAGVPVVPVGGAVVAAGVASDDPCPPLIAAAKAAQAACDDAIKAATAAADAARTRAAEAEAARSAREKARAAREEAERELEKRRQPPDPGRRLGETSYGGRKVHVDQYDLWLQEQARATANAAHKAALDAATSDSERQQAHDDWMKELEAVDGADGLDEVRRRDKDGRERWIKDAEASLKSAQDAEATADAEVTRTAEAASTAESEAAASKATADDACARAEAAAAAAAGCVALQTPVVPAAAGTPEGQGGTPPPAAPPGPEPPPTPPPIPPGPTPKRPCPDDSEPRISTSGAFEVDLFVLSGAQLNIDGAFMFSAAEGDAALEDFEAATAASDVAVGLIGAVTDPVGSILGSLGVPSFDTVTQAPTAAAQKALNRLNEQTATEAQDRHLDHHRPEAALPVLLPGHRIVCRQRMGRQRARVPRRADPDPDLRRQRTVRAGRHPGIGPRLDDDVDSVHPPEPGCRADDRVGR